MTKETLERAKTLDSDIDAISKALNVLCYRQFSDQQLRIESGLTGFEFKFNELDTDTQDELLKAMKDVLRKRKSSMINELEEL